MISIFTYKREYTGTQFLFSLSLIRTSGFVPSFEMLVSEDGTVGLFFCTQEPQLRDVEKWEPGSWTC